MHHAKLDALTAPLRAGTHGFSPCYVPATFSYAGSFFIVDTQPDESYAVAQRVNKMMASVRQKKRRHSGIDIHFKQG
jgi:hypothetical protein